MSTATIYSIEDRYRERMSIPTQRTDFELGPGQSFDASSILTDPTITPYGFDTDLREALFVQLPATIEGQDMAAAPFYYMFQFEQAHAFITIPYADFLCLADLLDTNLNRVVWLFNIGRCGSTLLHHVFNRVPNVICLSESDALTQFIYMHDTPEKEKRALLRATMKFLFSPRFFPASADSAVTKVIKFRNQNTETIELFHDALPHARTVFLYREAVGWCNSLARIILRHGPAYLISPEESLTWLTNHHGRPIDLAALGLQNLHGPLTLAERLALSWLIQLDRFLQVPEKIRILACNYNQLTQQRTATLEHLFAYCNLPQSAVPAALAAFEHDSQAGTRLARSGVPPTQLDDDEVARIHALISHHPYLNRADFQLPNTQQLTS